MTPSRPELSIVIPAFNEERRLSRSLELIRTFIANRHIRAEVLVVDDGSTDDTAKVVERSQVHFPELRLVSNGRNRGKGFSVRHGMLTAKGEIGLFTDADLSAPIEEADKLIAVLRGGAFDGAIGSGAINRGMIDVHQSLSRELAGQVYNGIVRCIAGLP